MNDANASDTDDTISLAAGCTYSLTTMNSSDETGATALPVIPYVGDGGALIINGNGATIERSADTEAFFRLFAIASGGDLTLNNLTVRNGSFADESSAQFSSGGGILNRGVLTLSNVNVTGNTAGNCGGGVSNGPIGGFIHLEDGTMTITNSTISGNHSLGCGGGIYNNGSLILTNSTVDNNQASGGGSSFFDSDCSGGGIFSNGNLTLTSSTISNNTAVFDGGGICGSGLTMTDSTISGNSAGHDGGGVFNNGTFSMITSSISDNTADSGAGIYNANDFYSN
ncbi:MAG: hypothetical protein ABI700_20370, partial [Chloroflexota bacterium]